MYGAGWSAVSLRHNRHRHGLQGVPLSALRMLVVEACETDNQLPLREMHRSGFESWSRQVETAEARQTAPQEQN